MKEKISNELTRNMEIHEMLQFITDNSGNETWGFPTQQWNKCLQGKQIKFRIFPNLSDLIL